MEILVITKKKKTMEETKFKVGDIVKVKSLDWYNSNKTENGSVNVKGPSTFTNNMKKLCGKFFCIEKIDEVCISLKTQKDFVFHSWMLEDQVYELEEVDLSKEEVNVNDPKFFTRNLVPLWIEVNLSYLFTKLCRQLRKISAISESSCKRHGINQRLFYCMVG